MRWRPDVARSLARIAAGIALATTVSAVSGPAWAETYLPARDTVTVSGGNVAAAIDSRPELRIFKAIPFAAPPVGPLRWRAPQAVVPWSGVRRSDSFSAACFMGVRPGNAVRAILYQESQAQSEDCLYLNVWTGAPAGAAGERRPVMLLLHGGGYLVGSGSQPNYSGTGLASKGAVVVTLNYRLGPLGFLAHPELSAESPDHASGNYALLDALAALRWVQANIAAFGGDPADVTLYSQSAGAGLASTLLGSPLAAGLFHRLVLESMGNMPAGAPTPALAEAEAAGRAFAANLGAADLKAMRAALPQDVMATAGALSRPIVDGHVLPDQLDLLFAAGRVLDVPLMVGWTTDEGTPYPPFATTLAGYEAASARFGALAPQFRAAYPATDDAAVRAMAYGPMRDGQLGWQPWAIARAHAALHRAKTWLYVFGRRPAYFPDQHFNEQDPPARYGAHHTLEQVYFYNNLDRSAPPRPYDATDRHVAEVASGYMVAFARNGDPNAPGLPPWPAFTGASDPALEIGDEIKPGPVPFRAALDFYDALYAAGLGRRLPF